MAEYQLVENIDRETILETGASTQNQEQIEQDLQYQAFKETGGSLTKRDYQKMLRMIERITNTPAIGSLWIKTANKKNVGQFEDEATKCEELGITTSLEQEAIYCFLRHRRGNHPPKRARGLTDQEIMADIILITGTVTDYNKYLEHYPGITSRRFPKTESKVEIMTKMIRIINYISTRPDYSRTKPKK